MKIISTTLSIWDLGGQERFDSFKESYMRGTAAIVLVFDLVNFDSFSKLDYYLETARNGAGNVPILLVGNKSDLETEEELGQVINQNEIDDWMRLNKITDFMKTSAKTGENVRKMFTKVTIMSLVELGEKPRMGEVQEDGFLFKVVVIGAAGVGKTSLVHRFTENVFLQDYKLTVGVDFIVKNLDIDEDLLPADVARNLKGYLEEIKAKKALVPTEEKPQPIVEPAPEPSPPTPEPSPEIEPEPLVETPPEIIKKRSKIEASAQKEVPPEKTIGVTYNKQMTLNSLNKFTLNVESEHFLTDPHVEITIKPEFPGCIVTPDEMVLDQAKPEEQIEFNITPMTIGRLDDACMKILHDKKQRYVFHTPSKVVSNTPTWILMGLALILLLMGPLFGQIFFSHLTWPVSLALISVIMGCIVFIVGVVSYYTIKKKHTEQAEFTIKDE